MAFYLSRQRDFSDNKLYVEIAIGGIKYAGKDLLTARYYGELKNLIDPRDAVRLAEDIYKKWDKDYWDEKKQLRVVGYQQPTIIFEFDKKGISSAKDWAEKSFQNMKKCGACGKAMGNKEPYKHDDLVNVVCCCENCLAKKYRDVFGLEMGRVVKDKLSFKK